MSSEWKSISLGECLQRVVDNRGKTPPLADTVTPYGVIEINAIVGTDKSPRFDAIRKYVSQETYDSWFRAGHPASGDVLFSTVGSIAEVVLYSGGNGCIAQNIVGLRPNAEVVYPDYLYYVLINPIIQSQLRTLDISSVQPSIKVPHLLATKIQVPGLSQQKKVAAILTALDDRITLLRETNTTLEAIAQALFKSWFIDFDPVRAKAEGLELAGMDAATAGLFPNSFEESELGLVPSGWKVGKVEDLMELPYGKALKATDRMDGPVPVYGSGGITGCHNESLVNGPSVIVGRKGTVGSLYWEDRPFFPIDTVFYVRTDTPLTYCYYLLQTLGLKDMNTDGAVPGLNRNNAYRLPVVVATTSILESFDEIVSSLRNKMFSNSQHTQSLIQLRDTLLPRLISGQLRLPEAEAMVEEICA